MNREPARPLQNAGSGRLLQIVGGTVLTPAGWVNADVTIRDGLVVAAERDSVTATQPDSVMGAQPDSVTGEPPEVLDARGLRVVPGFVDLQVNGGWGVDFASNPGGIWEVGAKLAETGVTSWLPTLVTSSPKNLPLALSALHNRPASWTGATPLGWHLEGPWLNPVRKGAHRRELLTTPSLPLDPQIDKTNGVWLVTLAPEIDGCDRAIAELVARGIVVSLGHSDASAGVAKDAFGAGATMGTHLFNAMSGLHHREPGLAAALLVSDAFVGLIVDGIHVVPDMVDLAWKAASERVVLVTDMMSGLGLPPGKVTLGRYEVHLDGVSARLADGTLAGSVLDMPAAIRNLVAYTGCGLADAIRAASVVPASVLVDNVTPGIETGVRGDLVLIDDDIQIHATVVDGHVVYRQSSI